MKKATSIPFGNRPPFYLSTLSKGSAQSQIEGLKKQAHASKQATHPVLNNNKDGKQLQLVSDLCADASSPSPHTINPSMA